MPCEVREFGSHTMVVCSRPRRVEVARCVVCGNPAPFLCDYEVAPGRTCDKPLCGQCRYNMGVKDYCPEHAPMAVPRNPGQTIVIDDDGEY